MLFRNLTMFRFSRETALDLERLDEVLPNHALRPVGPMELSARGFVPPLGGDADMLTHAVNRCTMVSIGTQDKLLPSSVIGDAVDVRVKKILEDEGRKVGGRERKKIKDDVMNELVPRAFIRTGRCNAYADRKNGWFVVDTASRKAAEDVLSQVREALGSFPAVPTAPQESARILMTHWVATGELPASFALGDECELRDPATASGAIARCRRQDMETEDVKEHLRQGKQVFCLGLVFDDRISFVLGDDLVLRKVKFTDVVLDEQADSHENMAAEADANFALMALEFERLLSKLAEIFVISRPE